jgi:hypothetical protein
MTWPWGLLAAAALLWPDRVISHFDGVPLDRPAEAILVGVAFAALWRCDPEFLKRGLARALIVALIGWRLASLTLAQEGWCVRFQPSQTYVRDQTGAPHAWDLRADWRAADPACSAIMTRSYDRFADFPAWFFNLPPAGDSRLSSTDRPPGATLSMTVTGFVEASGAGLLQVDQGPGVRTTMRIDGGVETGEARVTAGTHAVTMVASLSGDQWRFAPTWDGRPIWNEVTTTVRHPGRMDVLARQWGRWIPTTIVLALFAAWMASLVRRVDDVPLLAWSAAASAVLAGLVLSGHGDAARWATLALAASAAVPVNARNRNSVGAFCAIGVPWLAYICARSAPAIGRFTLYEWGDDFWTFQRYAYRIVLQGYWLEGGSPTFWFQPLYRWVAGALHVVFGDSSVGESFWDGACLLAGALWTVEAVRMRASFRWGLAAGATALATFMLGTPRDLIGRGLGEITSAGFIYAAASLALASAARPRRLLSAGLCAVLGFYTRLNNLPMALGVAAFCIPLDVSVRSALAFRGWLARVRWSIAIAIAGSLAAGALLFAARTWYYTGVFSVFHGTQRQFLAIWPDGMPLAAAASRMLDSLLMVITVNDPPRFDVYALPVIAGVVVGVLAVGGVPRARNVPLAVVLFLASALAGALVARGTAYPGRFSIHLIPVACAVLACGVAALPASDLRAADDARFGHATL